MGMPVQELPIPTQNASPGAAHCSQSDAQLCCRGWGSSVQPLKPILPLKGHLPRFAQAPQHSCLHIPASTVTPHTHSSYPSTLKHSLSLHLCAAEPYPSCCQLFPLRSFQILLSRAVLINRNTHSRNLLDSSPPCWVYFQQTCGKLRSLTRTRPSHIVTSPSSLRRILVPLHPGLEGLEEPPSRISALLAFPLILTHKQPYQDPHHALGCPNIPCPSP